MSKLTREEFRVLRTRAEHDLAQSCEVPSILICAGTGCIAGGAMKIYDNFKSECEARGLKVYVGLKHDSDEEKSLHVKMSGCHGFCEMGPLVHIEPMGVMYIHVKPEDCHEILEKTVLGGEVIDRLVYHLDGTAYPKQEDIPFYKKQHRVVLENCGTSDAEDIEEYIAKGGYSAFEKALFEMTDEQICRNILDSGLRGRGGGGFPAGRKWDGARKQKSAKKYIVCNGDEGDPGAFMDRSVMEGNPHSVLEGMMIAGLAVGSDEGYIYVRAEYPLAVNRLKTAIARAEEMGVYRKKVNVSSPVGMVLNLGLVHGVSEVFVNGQSCGVKWYGRRIHPVSARLKQGENSVEVHVVTVMGNYMKTLKDNKIAQAWTRRQDVVQPAGLVGPVTAYRIKN